jgi:hypothetical protein
MFFIVDLSSREVSKKNEIRSRQIRYLFEQVEIVKRLYADYYTSLSEPVFKCIIWDIIILAIIKIIFLN